MAVFFRSAAFRLWASVWWAGYALLRALVRSLVGREMADRAMWQLGLHFTRAFGIWYGGLDPYEPEFTRVLKKVLMKGGVFIDVGAYVGYYTLYAYRLLKKTRRGKVVAVEPDVDNFRVLMRRIPGDRLVSAVNAAIWVEDRKKLRFYRGLRRKSDNTSVSGSLTPTDWNIRAGHVTRYTVLVNTIRLDTLIAQFKLPEVKLAKMDIEGSEYHVLTDPLLDLSKIKNIIVEVHYNFRSHESRKIIRTLRQKGFRTVIVNNDPSGNFYHLLAYKGEIPW